jgi:hypothetical protein
VRVADVFIVLVRDERSAAAIPSTTKTKWHTMRDLLLSKPCHNTIRGTIMFLLGSLITLIPQIGDPLGTLPQNTACSLYFNV